MIILELVTPGNALEFKAVRLMALQDSPSAFGSTYAKESQFSDTHWLERATAWSSDRSIGYLAKDADIACGIAAGFLDEHDPQKAHLLSMWVAPPHRRTGIGRTLIDAIAAWARGRESQMLRLDVTSSNHAAIEFYRRNGFSMTGKTEPYPNDPTLVEYEMARSIL